MAPSRFPAWRPAHTAPLNTPERPDVLRRWGEGSLQAARVCSGRSPGWEAASGPGTPTGPFDR